MDIYEQVRQLRIDGFIEGELLVEPFWYVIWEPELLDEYNRDYELAEYAPDFFAIGGNGGGELLVIDRMGAVFSLPAIGMEPKYAIKIAEDIDELQSFMEGNG